MRSEGRTWTCFDCGKEFESTWHSRRWYCPECLKSHAAFGFANHTRYGTNRSFNKNKLTQEQLAEIRKAVLDRRPDLSPFKMLACEMEVLGL